MKNKLAMFASTAILFLTSCKDIINADGTHERLNNFSIIVSILLTILALVGIMQYLTGFIPTRRKKVQQQSFLGISDGAKKDWVQMFVVWAVLIVGVLAISWLGNYLIK